MTQAECVYDLVRRNPRRTSAELWAAADRNGRRRLSEETQTIRRRLSDLYRDGHIRRVGRRLCHRKRVLMYVWEIM